MTFAVEPPNMWTVRDVLPDEMVIVPPVQVNLLETEISAPVI